MGTALKSVTVFVHPQAHASDGGGTERRVGLCHLMPEPGRIRSIGDHAFIESGAWGPGTIKNQVMIWEGVTIEDDVFVGRVMFTNDDFRQTHGNGGTLCAQETGWKRRGCRGVDGGGGNCAA